jgi:hypothetical protein
MATSKQCPRCHTVKPLREFGRNASRPDGHAQYCKVCHRAEFNENYEKVHDRLGTKLTCVLCKETKDWTAFRHHSKTGFRTECRKCEKTQQRCSRCNEVKPLTDFCRDVRYETGHKGECKACGAARMRAKIAADPNLGKKMYHRHKDYHDAYQAARRQTRDSAPHT